MFINRLTPLITLTIGVLLLGFSLWIGFVQTRTAENATGRFVGYAVALLFFLTAFFFLIFSMNWMVFP